MKNEDFATAIVLFAMTFSAQVAHSQRAIACDGIENARDMGMLVMQDGQTVRTGMLVRSGNLSQATDNDVAVLKEKYHLTDVFDFRFEAEANAAPTVSSTASATPTSPRCRPLSSRDSLPADPILLRWTRATWRPC